MLLLDANPKRAVEIRRIAHLCGAGVRSCDGPDEARALRGAEAGGVAVCGIDSSCDAVRALKAAGFVVIGCQDGASAQPLGQQCQAFLAGCANLIDSARGDFADVLRAALLLRLKEDATRLKETSDVRTAMRAQGIVGDSKAMMSVFTSIMMRAARS